MQGRILTRGALRATALTAASAALLATPAIALDGPPPPNGGPPSGGLPTGPMPGMMPLGLEVKSLDPATRTLSGIQHCTAPDRAGKEAQFSVDPAVDLSKLAVGKKVAVVLDDSSTPAVIRDVLGEMPCNPGGSPGGNRGGKDDSGRGSDKGRGGDKGDKGNGGDNGPSGGDNEEPEFENEFVNRVWKFVGEADGFEDGQLSMTVSKILNLPKSFADQDDEIVDEDAIVLVGKKTKVYSNGKQVKRKALDDAEEVRVHGKMLDPEDWETDEDDKEVTTIRAKKVYILK